MSDYKDKPAYLKERLSHAEETIKVMRDIIKNLLPQAKTNTYRNRTTEYYTGLFSKADALLAGKTDKGILKEEWRP